MPKTDIGNPEALSSKEEHEFDMYSELFHEFLDELKNNNKIKIDNRENLDNFLKILKTIDMKSNIYNAFIKLVERENKEFLEKIKDFGFNTNNIAQLFVFYTVHLYNSTTETLKNGLILILDLDARGLKASLGKLFNDYIQTSSFAPKTGNKIKQLVDIDLRNSLSHHFYWLEGKDLMVSKTATLTNPESINLVSLMKKGKKANMIFHAFLKVFAEKARTNFFAST